MKNFLIKCLFALPLCFFMPNCAMMGQNPISISFGQSLTETLPTTSSTKTFKMPYSQPGDILFMRVKPNGIQIKFELLPPNGTQPLKTITGAFNKLVQEIYTIPQDGEPGEYRILISNIGIWTGDFCISLERMNEPPGAVFLGCDTSLTSNLTCGSSIKSFRYLMQQNARSRITVSPDAIAPEVWVCAPNGDILSHGFSPFHTQIVLDTILAPDTSCYYVFVADDEGIWDNGFNISHTTISGSCAAVTLQSDPAIGSLCEGETFALIASSPLPAASYWWSGPNGFTSMQPVITFDNASPLQSGVYTVVATSPTACSSIGSKTITVNPLPAAEASVSPASGMLCAGQNFTLNVTTNATGPVSYQWSKVGGGFNSTQKSPTISNADVSKSGTYMILVTDGKGCSKADSVQVTVNPLPSAIVSSPASGAVCFGAILQLGVTTDAQNASFIWSGPQGFSSTMQNPGIPNATFANQGTYSVTVTDAATGCSKTVNRYISVNSLPSANILGNLSICIGNTTSLTATGGGAYTWSTGQNLATITVNPSQTTIYTVTVTNVSTGCTDTESDTVFVKPLPSINIISTPADAEICSGSGIILLCITSNAENPAYQWTSTGFFSAEQCVTFDTPSESGTYVAVVTDGISGCSTTASLPVFIHPTPVVNILQTPESPYCAGTDFSLCATSNASNPNYQWTGPNNFSGSSLCISFSGISAAQSGTYNVSVTSSNGCTGNSSTIVEIGTLLQCEGQFTNETITVSASGSFPPYTYTLIPGGQTNSTGVFGNLDSNDAFSVTVTDNNGCTCGTGLLTGITDPVQQWGINISPNPGKGVFEIFLKTTPSAALQFILSDMRGRKLRAFTMETTMKTLDLTDLSAGLYVMRISDGKKIGGMRLVVTR